MARHITQNGQKCCDNHSPFKRTVHQGYNLPCSMIITPIAPAGAAGLVFPVRGLAPGRGVCSCWSPMVTATELWSVNIWQVLTVLKVLNMANNCPS